MAIWGLVLVLALCAQEATDYGAFDKRTRALRNELAGTAVGDRDALLSELLEIEEQLGELRPGANHEDRSSIDKALNRALRARARFDGRLSQGERVELYVQAKERGVIHGGAELRAGTASEFADFYREAGLYAAARRELEFILNEVPMAKYSRPFTLHKAAEVAEHQGDYLAALAWLSEAERIRPDKPRWEDLKWRIPGTRGSIWVKLGVLDLAEAELSTEWELVQPLRTGGLSTASEVLTACHHQLSLAYARGDHQRVLELAQETLAEEVLFAKYPSYRAVFELACGEALAQLDRHAEGGPQRAIPILRAALGRLGTLDRVQFAGRLRLAHALLATGDLTEAQLELQRLRELSVRWQAQRGQYGLLFEDALLASLEMRWAMESGAAESECLQRLEQLEAAVQMRLGLWAKTPLRPGGLGFLGPWVRRDLVETTVEASVRVRSPREALARLYEVQGTGSFVRASGLSVGEWSDFLPALRADGEEPPSAGALVFLTAPERSHVFAVDSAGQITHERLPAEAHLRRLARDYGDELQRWTTQPKGDREAERRAALSLTDALLPSSIQACVADWDAVTVVGLDPAWEAYVERLLLASGPYDRLGLGKAVSYLNSMPMGAVLEQRRGVDNSAAGVPSPGRAIDMTLVASPVPGPDILVRWPELVELPWGHLEQSILTGAYPGDRLQVLGGEAVTRERFLDLDFSQVAVLQILAHGVHDRTRERSACLVLRATSSDPGLLACQDLDSRAYGDAPLLALLTVCRSGAGPMRRGDAFLGHFGGTWLTAGTQAVIATEADLSFASALDFSASVHSELTLGATPAEALRRARVRQFDEHGEAGLVRVDSLRVLGLGHRRLFDKGTGEVTAATPEPYRTPVSKGTTLFWIATGLAGCALALKGIAQRNARTTSG